MMRPPGALSTRIGDRDGRQQRVGVRMCRRGVHPVAVGQLDDLAQVHHRDAIAHVAHDRQVVGDEDEAQLVLVLELASRFSTWAWMLTSSAETGSSSTITFGRKPSARAMPMRWRWPPENSCGYRFPCSGSNPTRFSSSPTRSAPPSSERRGSSSVRR